MMSAKTNTNNAKTSSPNGRRSIAAGSKNGTSLCRFYFHSGYCRRGDACRFSHDAHGMTREEALKTIQCPYFATGSCRYGEYCELSHDSERVIKKTEKKDDGMTDVVCGICLENVKSLKRKFGILSCCNHVFCHSCLMEWRTEGSNEVTSRRVCPTCRKQSDYVVPWHSMPSNDEEKAAVLKNYRDKLSIISCKHFDGNLGSCSFGSDCFYAHLDHNGKDVKNRDKTMQELYEGRQRHRNNRDRDIEYITDMIIMMGLQRHLNQQGRRSGGNRNRRGLRYDSDSDGDSEDDGFLLSPYMDFISSLMGDDDFEDIFGG
mmetsp:Transcript_32500/g.68670  ORF Transcript_32500/g.68670 Transcript_32500/m.68670 type:complete len:317 (-) Transcript_32500:3151-4101(-)